MQTPYNSPDTLVYWCPKPEWNFLWVTANGRTKQR